MELPNEQFDDMLDDVYPPYQIGGLTFTASQILRACDPIAYRIELNDYESFEEDNA
jgi:hypothetical protein